MRIYQTGASGLVGSSLPDVSTMLGRLRTEMESSWGLA